MRYELECIFHSQTDRRQLRTIVVGDIPYKPDLGDELVPYEFAQPLAVLRSAWDCKGNVLQIEAECEADLNQLEADFKRTRTAYTECEGVGRVS